MRKVDGVWQPDKLAPGMVARVPCGTVYDIEWGHDGGGLRERSRNSGVRFQIDAGADRNVIGLRRSAGDIRIGNTISGVGVINAKVVGVCDAHTVVVALPNDPREWLVDLDRKPLQLEAIPVASGPATADGISRYHTAKLPAEIGSTYANRYATVDDLKAIGVVPASAMPDVLRAMAGAAHRPFSLAARNPAAVVLDTLCHDVPASCIWAHEGRDAVTVYVDVPVPIKVSDDALRKAELVANAARPMDAVPVRVERSQMPALRAFAKAAEAYVKSPQGQRHIAEHHIRKDALRYPAFATARRAATMAYVETSGTAGCVPSLLAWLREYEDLRGIGREPSRQSVAFARQSFDEDIAAIYERYRGLP